MEVLYIGEAGEKDLHLGKVGEGGFALLLGEGGEGQKWNIK